MRAPVNGDVFASLESVGHHGSYRVEIPVPHGGEQGMVGGPRLAAEAASQNRPVQQSSRFTVGAMASFRKRMNQLREPSCSRISSSLSGFSSSAVRRYSRRSLAGEAKLGFAFRNAFRNACCRAIKRAHGLDQSLPG